MVSFGNAHQKANAAGFQAQYKITYLLWFDVDFLHGTTAASKLKKVSGDNCYLLPVFSDRQLEISDKEISDAQKFNFDPKFFKIRDF